MLGGVTVGVVFVLAIAGIGGLSLLSHTNCTLGPSLGNQILWTPFSLVNAPYLGYARYSAQFTVFQPPGSTTVRVTLSEGQVTGGNISAGYFETQNWTVFGEANTSTAGPGQNHPCVSHSVATASAPSFNDVVDGAILQGTGNTSNANEPTSFNDSGPQSAAGFANGFVSPNQPSVSTCGLPAKELNFSSRSFDFSLPVGGPSDPVATSVTISSLENFTYYFPANGGAWLVDDLQQNAGLRGPGLAFSWQHC
jgi:hypothetical protein